MCSVATSTAILAPPPRARPLSSPLGVPTTTQLNHEEDDVMVVTKKRRTSSGSRWDPAAHKDTMVELRKQGVRDAVATAHQAFRCPICLDTYGDMVVECAECAHVFCDPCMRESLKRKDKCPLCRCNPMPLRRCKPIERLVAALPEACAFLDNGCFDVTDMAIALRALLDISTTAWKESDDHDDIDGDATDDDATERARLDFVHAMLASTIVPPPA
ncbi:hypothetical protein DYB32_000792 [Aphanomyces invadans]|uniref:RING-type domain-containing protein n=1 Tax=Aphanomyces invadans TaxID=157072 RepID=A0A3R6WTC1_9STRA|nr:hypothetical protein DYB32_000792 [Aphanomyces invadans]